MYVVGGLVENQLLSREGLTRYAALPGIESLRGELCSVLNSGAQKTRSLLNSHQQKLSTNLEQYIRQLSPSNEETPVS